MGPVNKTEKERKRQSLPHASTYIQPPSISCKDGEHKHYEVRMRKEEQGQRTRQRTMEQEKRGVIKRKERTREWAKIT